ncbi:sodium channel protein Nach-like [Zophobas morio]|uniref:sodium channel protein Nach-like n=1 Tax=Zophobas morio TaxID=2755281 RepID=UPI0030833AC3
MKLVRRCKVVLQRLHFCIKKYYRETTLHGFRYITDPDSSKFKSYFWTIVCLISTVLCFILIRSQFRSYYSNRITTTILTTAFPIWEVPFPAVTICNFNLVYRHNTHQIRQATPDAIDNFFSNLSSLILSNKLDKDMKWTEHYSIVKVLERAGYNTEKIMHQVAHPCHVMITDCYWNNQEKNCSTMFHLVKTSSGFCCSFNYRGLKTDNEEIFVSGVGPSFGLYMHLNVDEDQYMSPLKHSSGIDVSIHENIQYPDMSVYSTTIRPGTDVSLSIKPEIIYSEEDVKDTPIKTRGCAFAEEVPVEWTSSYSYTTCINKCKAKAVYTLCRCIPYYYYPIIDMACLTKNNIKLMNQKVTYTGFRGGLVGLFKPSTDSLKCKCYPQCNEITYSYQQDQQPIKIVDIEETQLQPNDSVLRVYFGHVACTKLLKSVLITWELILASVGGLIGLCLGGSIPSVIEFVYHIFEALFSRYDKNKKAKKVEKAKYEPKLYLSDFGHVPQGPLFQVANVKQTLNKNKRINIK